MYDYKKVSREQDAWWAQLRAHTEELVRWHNDVSRRNEPDLAQIAAGQARQTAAGIVVEPNNHRFSAVECPDTKYPCLNWPFEPHQSASEAEAERVYLAAYEAHKARMGQK